MKVYLLSLFAAFLLLCGLSPIAYAQAVPNKDVLEGWVRENASVKLPENKLRRIISAAKASAALNDLNPTLILSVIMTESGFKDTSKSAYGATGLMQVVPRWHEDKLKGRNPYDVSTSIEVGVQILKDCWDKSKHNLKVTLSCYSGGGGKQYYKKVMSHHGDLKEYIKASEKAEENESIETASSSADPTNNL